MQQLIFCEILYTSCVELHCANFGLQISVDANLVNVSMFINVDICKLYVAIFILKCQINYSEGVEILIYNHVRMFNCCLCL